MAGDFSGEKSAPENEWANLLKDLELSQIAQVFNDVCFDCKSVLRSRLTNLHNQRTLEEENEKLGTSSIPCFETKLLSSPANGESSKLARQTEDDADKFSSPPMNGKPLMRGLFGHQSSPSSSNHTPSPSVSNGSPNDEEWRKFSQVGRKKDFVHYERIKGKDINVLQGLELHTGVFSPEEQKKIVDSVYNFQRMGQKKQLMQRTYTEPAKWMRGKGRVTIQFGCCYNYAVDKDGNPPGIIRDEEVDPLPPVFKQMISRMVKWHVLPPKCVPNSCIVNIYDEGDCIPPHIDHHDFLRPFCTVSFLTECNIMFGTNLKVAGPGEFSGPVTIPLPVGSVLVLNGNGADVAKHCIPAVPAKRISVTFRRMDTSKIPYNFLPDPELQNLTPLRRPSATNPSIAVQNPLHVVKASGGHQPNPRQIVGNSFALQESDFPSLGGVKSRKR
ncbi:RNA demethylase ALKBH9B-like [Silene latifolia]|uniref:RNA demethylase ALKBH9B-like n=1 Tax=Silene latifolia TaxID=37657 RepID=UPI003D774E0C